MRKTGMYEREAEVRKWQICSLFTVCAIFTSIVGGIHTIRALNARKINSFDFQRYYSNEFHCKSDNEADCYGGNNYDSCLVPTYLFGDADSAAI